MIRFVAYAKIHISMAFSGGYFAPKTWGTINDIRVKTLKLNFLNVKT